MPKRRRLFTPSKNKIKANVNNGKEVITARVRLKGALMEVLEPAQEEEESDASSDYTPNKRDSQDQRSDEEQKPTRRLRSPLRQSYVLKLFDRSVDLSQFSEDSPLYPICRAWMVNQPRINYSDLGKREPELEPTEDMVELPGPEGPPVSKIPPLIPEQLEADKNRINLNYREAPPPSREQLLAWHTERWMNVRQAWLEQAAKVEARYEATQEVLNKINANNC